MLLKMRMEVLIEANAADEVSVTYASHDWDYVYFVAKFFNFEMIGDE